MAGRSENIATTLGLQAVGSEMWATVKTERVAEAL
eukprot:CAMPEP_0181373110 /NCGR_PEP_ID=MMETSP1106-20121128/15171_1 /TAXON_ID=81844 /ORGANISM="Mantoniella antarctica, Strain SL-175" /LENGTH=34 /DNA_ID= /DNA_START= /DNA_END= /DNA_ORIENTATION=